jgi:two-component system chemotaxis response regulator CheB
MINVMIVDDSAVIRKALTEILSKHEDIEVIGTAVDPYVARDKILKLKPDVITLDLEMPRMDGLSFLATLMKHYPIPVVVLSSLTPKNSDTALKALDLGAVEVLSKPGGSCSIKDIAQSLARAIRAAASARIKINPQLLHSTNATAKLNSQVVRTTHKVIAIGASTGGTKAIETVLHGMPVTSPGILIAQHMPENFTTSFAKRLNEICPIEVREACQNDQVEPGVALVAPGNHHLILRRSDGNYLVRIKEGPRVHFQRPSIDVLFQSVAKMAGRKAIGVLLTGMGADGAKGMLAMKESGARTIAQDEDSCVVFGMPKETIRLGAADEIVSLPDIPKVIINALQDKKIKGV